MNKTTISFPIIRKQTTPSPFEFVIYKFKTGGIHFNTDYMIECPDKGKTITCQGYELNKYLTVQNVNLSWQKLPLSEDSWISVKNNEFHQFGSIYEPGELARFANLEFNWSDPEYIGPKEQTEKIPEEVAVNNFHLTKSFDTSTGFIRNINIVCTLPLFRIYTFMTKNNHYESKICIMKLKNKYYRFPYGHSANNDGICFGIHDEKLNTPEAFYLYLVTNTFSEHAAPHIRFGKDPTTFDFKHLKSQIDKNIFKQSLIDTLFYLSQINDINEYNENLFIQSPNIPKEIIEYENSEQISGAFEPV